MITTQVIKWTTTTSLFSGRHFVDHLIFLFLLCQARVESSRDRLELRPIGQQLGGRWFDRDPWWASDSVAVESARVSGETLGNGFQQLMPARGSTVLGTLPESAEYWS
jgi:hypothetical protein